MSATVRQLEREEVFWFGCQGQRVHAFELVEGELEPLSACGKVELETCDDEPIREPIMRKGWSCLFCLALVAA